MKGDLKGIDVGDDIEEIGMEDEEDEDSQGQANGSNSSAKWDNHSFIFFIWKKLWIYTFSMIKIIIRHFVIYNKDLPTIVKELEIKFRLTKFSML